MWPTHIESQNMHLSWSSKKKKKKKTKKKKNIFPTYRPLLFPGV